jgi:hypothetical protein
MFFIDAYSDLFINDLPTILCTFFAIFATVLAINDKHTLSVKHSNTFEEAKTIEFQMKGCKEGQVSLVKK